MLTKAEIERRLAGSPDVFRTKEELEALETAHILSLWLFLLTGEDDAWKSYEECGCRFCKQILLSRDWLEGKV